MTEVKHEAKSRGFANYGWLESYHTFSFASYYNPERMGFGVLRVINDDVVAPAYGFETHPHKNMEIVSIPLRGALKHKDTLGNEYVIKKGEVQAMSAGTGIQHSEFNNSTQDDVNFLQIWIMPKKQNIAPSYSQKEFIKNERLNKLQLIVSPDGRSGSVEINQDAYFSMINLDPSKHITYKKYEKENGVYLFVIEGELEINGNLFKTRDGHGLEKADNIELISKKTCEVLIMEVPMNNQGVNNV